MELRNPLSFGQERIWFLERLMPGLPIHNISISYEITGPLDPVALDAAFRHVVARHSPLRTSFHEADGRPYCVVHEDAPAVLDVVDVNEADLLDRVRAVTDGIFDLSTWPLLRVELCRTGEDIWVLTVVVHHIVADGWSLSVLFDDLCAAYNALRADTAWRPPMLPLTYERHVVQERQAARNGSWDRDIAYWRGLLRDAPPLFSMPGSRPRPTAPTQVAHQTDVLLEQADALAVHAFAKQRRASSAMVLAAAWAVALHRQSGATDIVLGMPVSGRDRAELNGLIGLFMNPVPLRVRVAPGMSFDDLVDHVRDQMLGALAHRRPPFAALVAELDVERSLAYLPIFQVLFNHATVSPQPFAASPELGCRRLPAPPGLTQADIGLVVVDATDADGALRLAVECSGDIYDDQTPKLLLGHLVTVLRHALNNSRAPLDLFRTVTASERDQLTAWCAPPETPVPAAASALELVVGQIARTPDAPAVTGALGSLTYAELGRAAAALAERLRRHGAGRGTVVAVNLDRSVEALTAMLAAWHLGAAYLPVDPGYPEQRLRFILDDAGAGLIVSRGVVRSTRSPRRERPSSSSTTRTRQRPTTRPRCRCRPGPGPPIWPISSTPRDRPGHRRGWRSRIAPW
ncbi:condensation domain-containing protein [Micromonospora eburnea]|uniref:HxxPF-repeated domain-containing protein n=1 Tax=Micromonospora eburnea TaxID=227316 RepID=A0A1C6V1I8_9ACTN|nr:condensation domain-containing protein [Micromonospora eburnea]SCL60169.1 HxxPF-repeated domain-containing protein [Micromonospora eburnea]